MSKSLFAIFAFAALAFLPALAQERVKPKEAASVPAILDQAKSAFSEQRFGACMNALNEAIGLVGLERAKAIRAALPPAPEGFEIVPDKNANAMQNNPFAQAMLGGVGNMVQQDYRGPSSSINVSVTADSPLVQMFSMWVTNPAMLEEGAELIKYGKHNAVLKKGGGNRWEIQLLIDKTMVDVKSSGISDDDLLKFFNQEAVDALEKVLGT